MAVARKSTTASKAPAAPARTEADKLNACLALAMRLSAALKRSGQQDLSRKAFKLAAEIDALIP